VSTIEQAEAPSFSRHGTEKTISAASGVHVSSGSAETLARRDGIRNNHLIVYCLSNISAKN